MRSPLMNVDMGILLLQVTNRFMEKILENADDLKLFHAGNGDDLEASPDLCACYQGYLHHMDIAERECSQVTNRRFAKYRSWCNDR
jgi:hypothetical protein